MSGVFIYLCRCEVWMCAILRSRMAHFTLYVSYFVWVCVFLCCISDIGNVPVNPGIETQAY
ncbi:hypothetical protein BDF14DRAFT_1805551 [Spinellus fusiger]|nr:hypothetical protein BDF14DRAFT_1805551 [Spinellus fusiger]